MRRLTTPVACLVLLGALGCGSTDESSAPEPGPKPAKTKTTGGNGGDDGGGGNGGGAGSNKVPDCPLTAEKAAIAVRQPMIDKGNCLFHDPTGVASLTITMSSQSTGAGTFDFLRSQAEEQYGQVKDADLGDKAYVAADDTEANGVVVSGAGTYTVTLSGFARFKEDPAIYESSLRSVLDAILA